MTPLFISSLLNIILFTYFGLLLGLHCCMGFFLLSVMAVHGLLIAVASIVSEHGLYGMGFSSYKCGLRVVTPRF